MASLAGASDEGESNGTPESLCDGECAAVAGGMVTFMMDGREHQAMSGSARLLDNVLLLNFVTDTGWKVGLRA